MILLFSRSILYFHENQLVYPVQTVQDRDFQFGYNQILSALGSTILISSIPSDCGNSSRIFPFNTEIQFVDVRSCG
jgi:hypothetical protein